MENKTQSIVIDHANSTIGVDNTTHAESKPIYLDQLQAKTNTNTKKHKNPFYAYFPKFYVNELKTARFSLYAWTFIFLCAISLTIAAFVIVLTGEKRDENWLLLLLYIIPSLVIFGIYINKIISFLSLNSEAKTINFSQQKIISINIIKIYKKLKIANINANWFCSLLYSICVAAFFIIVLVAWIWGTYKDVSGNPMTFDWKSIFSGFSTNPIHIILVPTEGFYVYFVTFITVVVVFFLTIIAHIYILTNSALRISRIENYYNSFIVSPDEIANLKKSTNRRDMVIFLVVNVLLGLIIYSLIKAKKQKSK